MSWFNPAEALSEKAEKLFTELADSNQSETIGVVECLNTIAWNGEEQATDAYLVGCAKEMREAAQRVIDELS